MCLAEVNEVKQPGEITAKLFLRNARRPVVGFLIGVPREDQEVRTGPRQDAYCLHIARRILPAHPVIAAPTEDQIKRAQARRSQDVRHQPANLPTMQAKKGVSSKARMSASFVPRRVNWRTRGNRSRGGPLLASTTASRSAVLIPGSSAAVAGYSPKRVMTPAQIPVFLMILSPEDGFVKHQESQGSQSFSEHGS
jgi:hypothetical protein